MRSNLGGSRGCRAAVRPAGTQRVGTGGRRRAGGGQGCPGSNGVSSVELTGAGWGPPRGGLATPAGAFFQGSPLCLPRSQTSKCTGTASAPTLPGGCCVRSGACQLAPAAQACLRVASPARLPWCSHNPPPPPPPLCRCLFRVPAWHSFVPGAPTAASRTTRGSTTESRGSWRTLPRRHPAWRHQAAGGQGSAASWWRAGCRCQSRC